MMTEDEQALQFRRIEDRERLAVLEIRVADHSDDLKEVFKHQEILAKGVEGINKTLRMIMYSCVGAAVTVVMQDVGLLKLLVKLLT